MDFPFPNNAPEGGNAGAATDDFWAFNPQQPPPMNAQADDTSLDELLALYQTANDAPPAPFAPTGEPESYPFDASAGADAFPAFDAGAAFGDPATDAPFPAFGAEGDAFPAFGGDAPAFPAFGDAPAPGTDAFPAFDAGAAFGEAPAAGGFDMPFDSSVPPAADAGFGGFESVVPEAGAGGFDLGGFDSSVPPLGDAGGFPAFDAAPAAELPADFGDLGDLGGPVFPAFGEEPAAAAPEAGAMEFPAFGADEAPAFPAFDAAPADDGLAELGDLSGGPVFEAFDAMPAAAEEPLSEFPAFDEGAPMFPAFDAAPAAEAPAAFEAPAAAEAPTEFPAFGADEPMFPAFEATGAAFDAAPAGEEPVFGAFTSDDEGPLFPPLEAPAAEEPTPAPAAAAPVADAAPLVFGEEELEEFVPDEEAPLFPAVTEGPVFPAFEAAGAAFEAPAAEAAPEAPAELPDFGGDAFAFPPLEPAPEPFVAAAPEPKVEAAPVVPAVDPEQTLRYREVPAAEPAPAAAAPSFDAAALASMTGKEVVIKTPEDRRAANQQLTQVVGSLSTGLDEIQGRMAHLYADLQKAAVSRAPVDEIQRITADLANAKASVGEGSDLYKQALYLRQMADAYLQVLKEL